MKDFRDLKVGQKAHPLSLAVYRTNGQLSPRGVIGANHSTAALVFFDLGQSGGGMRAERGCRAGSLLLDRPGISQRIGLPLAAGQGSKADWPQGTRRTGPANQRS